MKNTHSSTYITVGKIGTTFGVRGWLKVQTYTEFGSNILNYDPWYINNESGWEPLALEEKKLQGRDVLVKISHVDTPEQARLLTGKLIAVTRSQLPALKENEYYWSDLIGLKVVNKDGREYGKVVHLMETGSNDVLIVKGEKEEAIPFLLGQVVLKVDLVKKEILVDWELI